MWFFMNYKIDDEITELERQLASASEEITIFQAKIDELSRRDDYGSDEMMPLLDATRDALSHYNTVHRELMNCQERKRKMYRRPVKGLFGFISNLLPALPDHETVVHPTKDVMRTVPAAPKKLFWAFAAAAAVTVMTYVLFPWASVFPYTFIAGLFEGFLGEYGALIVGGILMGLFLTLVNRRVKFHKPWLYNSSTTYFDYDAVDKVYWFHYGAEKWSLPTQIWASLMFGLVQSSFLMPASVVCGLATFGFIMMRIYVKTFEQTGSVEQATLTITKMHASATRILLFVVAPIALVALVVGLIFL